MNNVDFDQGMIRPDRSECLIGFARLFFLESSTFIGYKEPWQVRPWKHLSIYFSLASRTSCSRFHTWNKSHNSRHLMVVENLSQQPVGEVVREGSYKKPE